jgi:protein gp37
MKNSKIEWCDHTFNPWEGCTKVSPGCANCYAEVRNSRWNGGTSPNWGKGAPRRRTSLANWRKPLQWNKDAAVHPAAVGTEWERNSRPRVFCASLADWLDDEVPVEWLADLLALVHKTPNLDWLLLTKRPQNWADRLDAVNLYLGSPISKESMARPGLLSFIINWRSGYRPANIWIGTTVEDQIRAEERIPKLLEIPARVRFLSCEPLLRGVDLRHIDDQDGNTLDALTGDWGIEGRGHTGPSERRIHWVIAGGESGKGARPMYPSWATSIRDQCQAVNVPFFFKQWGEWAPRMMFYNDEDPEQPFETNCGVIQPDGLMVPMCQDAFLHQPPIGSQWVHRVEKKTAGRLMDGREWNEFPE